jgi:hypothetical protein
MLVQGEDWDQVQSSECGNLVFLVPSIEEAILSPMHILGFCVENQIAIAVWVCVRVF